MRSQKITPNSIRKPILVILAGGVFGLTLAAQSDNGSKRLELPDPTPRPPDLKKIYEENPAEQARQQQVALLRAAQRREQVIEATNRLALVAGQLKVEMENRSTGEPLGPNAQKAAEIEKLAKTIKNTMKSQ